MPENNKPQKQNEPGQYIGMGIAIGVSIGVAIGVALDNIALGIGVGLPIGVSFGVAFEEKAKKEGVIRELSPEEQKGTKRSGWLLVALGLALLIGAGVLYFLR